MATQKNEFLVVFFSARSASDLFFIFPINHRDSRVSRSFTLFRAECRHRDTHKTLEKRPYIWVRFITKEFCSKKVHRLLAAPLRKKVLFRDSRTELCVCLQRVVQSIFLESRKRKKKNRMLRRKCCVQVG